MTHKNKVIYKYYVHDFLEYWSREKKETLQSLQHNFFQQQNKQQLTIGTEKCSSCMGTYIKYAFSKQVKQNDNLHSVIKESKENVVFSREYKVLIITNLLLNCHTIL